ncbi:hypothetical protein GCM10010341_90660 [Streptomyces noursei]|nr:hypothetical protein GCM10010341_90660 [Streptomyces noursei]
MFACLSLIRWHRRLRQLRRLADAAPTTRTRLPCSALSIPPLDAVPPGLPEEFHPASTSSSTRAGPAAVDDAELDVRAWLHHCVLRCCSPAASARGPNAAALHSLAPQTQQEESDG